MNAGQICVAPDYILCHEKIYDQFIEMSKKVLNGFYKNDPGNAKDFGRIISPNYG